MTKQRVLEYLGWRAGPDMVTDRGEAAKWRAAAMLVAAVIIAVILRIF